MPGITGSLAEKADFAGLPALIDRPAGKPKSGLLLTHGAGGDKASEGLRALAESLAALGHLVVRFDLPYRAQGRKSPPAAERSVEGFGAAFEHAVALAPSVAWFAGGKSYGGRVASTAVAEGLPASGLVFYGYPLHAPGKQDSPRVGHWPKLEVPCLFLQGTQDPFCNLLLLKGHMRSLPQKPELVIVEGGGHSLDIKAAQAADGRARSQAEVIHSLAPRIGGWLASAG